MNVFELAVLCAILGAGWCGGALVRAHLGTTAGIVAGIAVAAVATGAFAALSKALDPRQRRE